MFVSLLTKLDLLITLELSNIMQLGKNTMSALKDVKSLVGGLL